MGKEELTIKVKCTDLKNVLEAFKIANNAIYFSDSSDYIGALYDVCKTLAPEIDENQIGIKYFPELLEGEE